MTVSATSGSDDFTVSVMPNLGGALPSDIFTAAGVTVMPDDVIVIAASGETPFRLLEVSFSIQGAETVTFELIDATTDMPQLITPEQVE